MPDPTNPPPTGSPTNPPSTGSPEPKPFTLDDFKAWLKSDEGQSWRGSTAPPAQQPQERSLDDAIEAYLNRRESSKQTEAANAQRDADILGLKHEIEELKKRGRDRIRSLFEF